MGRQTVHHTVVQLELPPMPDDKLANEGLILALITGFGVCEPGSRSSTGLRIRLRLASSLESIRSLHYNKASPSVGATRVQLGYTGCLPDRAAVAACGGVDSGRATNDQGWFSTEGSGPRES